MTILCGILMWFDGQRYLSDEPNIESLEFYEPSYDGEEQSNPWYAPIEDEI